ncbi:MgtC/SapB family protein [Tenacibaculum sp. Mcav3-52]|uniref:MgtC/SapB family protein n=1 Tax=unclassified Tenacibaculum TaxID=2635139 RepID=UPI001EF2E7AE|nr:MgtC/SapB family protein [Tenacibaculum sp. Mcav3-52]MCG7501199.1 MgtC/SapB family protein [Tenacibaculum sp. Mcav3-52]
MIEALKNINPFILGLLISLGIGLILGLEREYDKLKEEQGFAGIRTFPIVAIIGFILGSLSITYTPWLVIIIASAFLLFLSLSHLSIVQKHAMTGITTNLALFATLILGVMVANHLHKEAVATAVVIVTLLSLKTTFNTFIKNITSEELFAFIKFSIIALLILPFLPNQDYGSEGLLNPFEIGAIIVIVSFLNFIGYFLVKYVGSQRGILLTAILGGLISSTAVSWIYASRSKESPELSKQYAAGIIIASAIMFPRLAVLAYIFNNALIAFLVVPFSILTFICLVSALFFMKKDNEVTETGINLGNPLNIWNALGFGAIYIGIAFAVFYGNQFFGEKGLYYSALIAGLGDTDAITISMSKFGVLEEKFALVTNVILTATISNMIVKLGITYFKGSKKTRKLVMLIFGSVIIVGITYILIQLRN